MFEDLSISDILGLATVIFGGVMIIVGAVVKFTKTKKDDEVFEDVKQVVDPLVDALNKKTPKS